MTKEEIIEMAKEAGLAIGVALDGSKSVGKHEDKSFAVGRLPLEDFVAFVKLVAEKEREACNAICLDTYEWAENLLDQDEKHFAGRMRAAQDIGNAIQARGQE